MVFFERVVRLVSQVCDRIAQFVVMAMMLLVVGSILLRIAGHPAIGSYDFVRLAVAITAALAIAYCAMGQGHVSVELVVARLPQRAQGIIGSITGIISLGFFALVTSQLVIFGNRMWQVGEVMPTVHVPIYPYIYGMAFGCALLCLTLLVNLIKLLVKGVRG